MKKIFLFFATTGLFVNSYSQNLTWEIFSGLGSYAAVSTIKTAPSKTYVITSLNTSTITTSMDGYYSRVKGFIVPPATGDYYFWVSSDDGSQLWLSTNSDSLNKVKVAYTDAYLGSYTNSSPSKSALIPLVAGNYYYFEMLHNEGSGGDWLKVGWTKPGEAAATVNDIPGSSLSRTGAPKVYITGIPVAPGRIPIGNKGIILYKFSVAPHESGTKLTKLTLTADGVYSSTDMGNFKLYYNKYPTQPDSAKKIGRTLVTSSPGMPMVFDSIVNFSITTADSIVFIVTADVLSTAQVGATINITETNFSNVGLTGTVKYLTTDTIIPAGGLKWIEKIDAASVKISKDVLTLLAGNSGALSAIVSPDSTSFKGIVWSSDNTSKATVDSLGRIKTIIDGTVNIIVTTKDMSRKDTCVLTILPNDAAIIDLYLDPGILQIAPGNTAKIKVVTNPVYVSRSTLVMTSTNPAVATIDTGGLVTAVSAGKAIIIATMQGDMQAMCVVNVGDVQDAAAETNGICIYPNPVKDKLVIVSNEINLYQVQIINIQGVLVGEGLMTDNSFSMDMSLLPSGIYIVKIISDSKVIEKIISKE